GSWVWLTLKEQARRAATEELTNKALDQAAGLLSEGKWPLAVAHAERAGGLLAGGGSPEQRRRVDEVLADLKMLAEVEDIRLRQAALKDGSFDTGVADAGYAKAFREYGCDVERLPPQEAGERLRQRGIAVALAAALDHWARVRGRTRKSGEQSWK